MLHEFLKTIQDEEVQNLLEVSRIFIISSALALQMVDSLTRKGNLQEMDADCDTQRVGC